MKIVRTTEMTKTIVHKVEVDSEYVANMNKYINDNFYFSGYVVQVGNGKYFNPQVDQKIEITAEDIADAVEGNAREAIANCYVKSHDPQEYQGYHLPLTRLILDLLEVDLTCWPGEQGEEMESYSATDVYR